MERVFNLYSEEEAASTSHLQHTTVGLASCIFVSDLKKIDVSRLDL